MTENINIILNILNKCSLLKCNDDKYNSLKEYSKLEHVALNNILETNNLTLFNNLKKDFYHNEIYRKYINCKITNCYSITELYLKYMINRTPELHNYKKENDKFTVDDYINIKSKYNDYY